MEMSWFMIAMHWIFLLRELIPETENKSSWEVALLILTEGLSKL